MLCPGCRKPLSQDRQQCPRCGGVFADRLEDLPGLAPDLLGDFELPMSLHRPGEAPRHCPRCEGPFLLQREVGTEAVEVCAYCGGVFVERVVLLKRSLPW
ncbi:MAG: zf-TFIIB domain-containing protein [Candidatus Eremiobacterota bacterium]